MEQLNKFSYMALTKKIESMTPVALRDLLTELSETLSRNEPDHSLYAMSAAYLILSRMESISKLRPTRKSINACRLYVVDSQILVETTIEDESVISNMIKLDPYHSTYMLLKSIDQLVKFNLFMVKFNHLIKEHLIKEHLRIRIDLNILEVLPANQQYAITKSIIKKHCGITSPLLKNFDAQYTIDFDLDKLADSIEVIETAKQLKKEYDENRTTTNWRVFS